jgi:hypothetical protein
MNFSWYYILPLGYQAYSYSRALLIDTSYQLELHSKEGINPSGFWLMPPPESYPPYDLDLLALKHLINY